MPNMNWSELSSLQLGRYAEYYAKMEFASYGFEVYTSEVDDHGVDFIVKAGNNYYEIQVKGTRNNNTVNIPKTKMDVNDANRLVCYIRFINAILPDVYVIPATAWQTPNGIIAEHNYGNEGQTSTPEWSIQYSQKNKSQIECYEAKTFLSFLKVTNIQGGSANA